jgi:tripartite-type tricarboxylate transporter receptor subunit TctC
MSFARLVCALLAGMLAAPAPAQAQPYPARPVTLVVPFPAGGLLMTTSTTMAINVSVFKSLPYDPVKDFAPVALVTGVPFVLVVNPALPVQSIPDLVALAKSKPGGLDYVSTGPGSAANLYAVLLKNALAIPMTPIPYKGNAQGLNDVVAGHVSVMLSDLLTALPLVRAGKLRALGLTTAMRVGAAPEIAPLAEVGVPGYEASAWQMVVAPAQTPKEIVGRLSGAQGDRQRARHRP